MVAQGTFVPLKVGVLGPMRVVVDGRPVMVSAGRQRVLLAVLAVSAGRSVPTDRLAAALWQNDPPGNPRRSVQTYVTRLRALLGDRAIRTRTGGYLLDVPSEAVDTQRFDRFLARADGAEDPTARRSLLTEALRLWRGEPFEDLASPWLTATEAPGLVERYLTAVEHCADLDLLCGRHAGLAADLTRMAAQHPLRESLWVRLLLVLARCGRPAEALAQYETIRARLADELGVDPGLELRRVHADLLAGVDPPLDQPASASAVPRQLSTFVGRVCELKRAGADVAALSGMAASARPPWCCTRRIRW